MLIPVNVASIGESGFCNCSKLEYIDANPSTPPTIKASTFRGVKSNGTLGCYDTSATAYTTNWMQSGAYYLGYYHWGLDVWL